MQYYFYFFPTTVTLWAVGKGQIWPVAHCLLTPDVDGCKLNITAVMTTTTGPQSSGTSNAAGKEAAFGGVLLL